MGQERESSGFTDIWLGSPDRSRLALGPGSWEYIYVDQERESSGFTDIWLGSPDKSRLGRGAGNMDVAQRVDPFR